MSWFNASQLSTFAKQALSQAQKSIDRVLDIQGEEEEEGEGGPGGAAQSRVGEAELGLVDGQELAVADVTTPQTVLFRLHFTT